MDGSRTEFGLLDYLARSPTLHLTVDGVRLQAHGRSMQCAINLNAWAERIETEQAYICHSWSDRVVPRAGNDCPLTPSAPWRWRLDEPRNR